jgi:hypothetical protein
MWAKTLNHKKEAFLSLMAVAEYGCFVPMYKTLIDIFLTATDA